jgi:hypothetical protein
MMFVANSEIKIIINNVVNSEINLSSNRELGMYSGIFEGDDIILNEPFNLSVSGNVNNMEELLMIVKYSFTDN